MSDTTTGAVRPAVPVSRPVSTGDTVTVACKLPHGLMLRVFEWEEYDELQRDGSVKQQRRARPIEGKQFVVRGVWAASAGQAFNPNNAIAQEMLPGGYALTHGCPKEIWEKWSEQNRDSLLIRNHIVFASSGDIYGEAHTYVSVKTGMEPIERANPGARMPGGVDRRLKIGILDTGDDNVITR